jgi:predicted PurR-regulated permease PerM
MIISIVLFRICSSFSRSCLHVPMALLLGVLAGVFDVLPMIGGC